MNKKLMLFLAALLPNAVFAYQLGRVSVHDPSVVWEPNSHTYYIFGSHRAAAKTTDMMNWSAFIAPWQTTSSNNASNADAFTTNQTKTVTIGGQQVPFGNFNVYAYSGAYTTSGDGSTWNINGNMWAPDVIYNPVMKKWCMYLSINGFYWNSSIILLTADQITGPYLYQGPVVFSGFTSSGTLNYKNTDLELAIGEQASIPARYTGENIWRRRWPHCIDPCVFYDETGKLWMSYGSWSAGIWMLELDENTGLRDYDVKYEYALGSADENYVLTDPYFGKKIAGGFHVSGEASYIKHIGNYYYLFVTYGGLNANGGYQMRVFRSENPDGPYYDSYRTGAVAVYNGARVNYGPSSNTDRGENIFGAYGEWGYQTRGINSERSQGHNSIINGEDGRTYLVYHTRFQDRGEEHEVRVHQVFVNKDGWLVAAPFEYTGEQVTSADIATTQQIATDRIAGNYKLLIHPYRLDHENKQLALPVEVSLNADGSVTGAHTGSWNIEEGTSYMTITLGSDTYRGVFIEQTLEPTDEKVPAFTALNKANGVTCWGYQLPEGYQDMVGASDNSTGYLGAFSTQLQLTEGQMATFQFTNYSSKAENWHNWVACVSPGTAINAGNLFVALRADRWENVQFSGDGVECNYNWDTFKNDMDGSDVVLTVKYQEGRITLHADITTAGGTKYYEEFSKAGVSGTVTTCLSVDHSHLVVSKAEVGQATGIQLVKGNATGDGVLYDLQGRRVAVPQHKGVYIMNGRKVVMK